MKRRTFVGLLGLIPFAPVLAKSEKNIPESLVEGMMDLREKEDFDFKDPELEEYLDKEEQSKTCGDFSYTKETEYEEPELIHYQIHGIEEGDIVTLSTSDGLYVYEGNGVFRRWKDPTDI